MSNSGKIYIAAAVLTWLDGATLLVRKRGTSAFMHPEGKIDTHEEPVEALCRELRAPRAAIARSRRSTSRATGRSMAGRRRSSAQ